MYKQKKWAVIIKVDAVKFIKYQGVTNFPSLYRYLDKAFPNWRFGTVYSKKLKVGLFTKRDMPNTFPHNR